MVVINLLQHFHELLHRVVFQFTLSEVGLLDEELDVGLLLLLVDALVGMQESWDNAGLQLGLTEVEVSGALLCLDVNEAIIDVQTQ